jgi:hypothetical protein
MKRPIILTVASCTLTALVTVVLVERAASQPRINTTAQLQVIGAAANNESHGAWFIDLQSGSVVFCERLAKRVECSRTPLP